MHTRRNVMRDVSCVGRRIRLEGDACVSCVCVCVSVCCLSPPICGLPSAVCGAALLLLRSALRAVTHMC